MNRFFSVVWEEFGAALDGMFEGCRMSTFMHMLYNSSTKLRAVIEKQSYQFKK